MDWLKIVWIILFILLLLFPIGYILLYCYKLIYKAFKEGRKKVQNIKAMDDMRKDLLRKKAEDTKKEIKQEIEQEEATTKKESRLDDKDFMENKKDVELDDKEKKELNKIIYDADNLKKEGNLDEYEKKLIEGLSIEPSNNILNKSLAEYYFNMGNYKKALKLFKSITEQNPDDHSAIWHLGQIYLMGKDYKMAEVLIQKAIHIVGDNPKYHISMVEIYYNTDRKLQAIGIMEKIIKLRPSNTNYMIALAELYEEVDDDKNARKYYFRVLENEPNNEIAKSKIQPN